MTDPIVSHGRGGQIYLSSKIAASGAQADARTLQALVTSAPTQLPERGSQLRYVDGEIVREGAQASTVNGPTSTGRGGQGNIGTPEIKAADGPKEVIPEAAIRQSQDNESYHVGRGGEGNIHHPVNGKNPYEHEGLADKLKRKIFGAKKAKAEGTKTPPKANTARGVPPFTKDGSTALGGTPANE
ncbi:MAG: hypothetical protein M4579_001919 [Chaenotheca gracillima]|nr:MAG: hypothetical protein M4579_001919 [Chaenotheca gracillima]